MSFVVSLDPNAKIDESNIVPDWPLYSQGSQQMVFNRTESEDPDIKTRVIDEKLVDRCR